MSPESTLSLREQARKYLDNWLAKVSPVMSYFVDLPEKRTHVAEIMAVFAIEQRTLALKQAEQAVLRVKIPVDLAVESQLRHETIRKCAAAIASLGKELS